MTRLFPVAASTLAERTDTLFFGLLVFSILIVLLVTTLVVVFAVRYRRGSPAPRPPLSRLVRREFEIGWTSAILFLALFFAWWASATQLSVLPPPADALEVHVIAKQWMWKVEHPSGAREIDELHLPVDEPVRLAMTSQDVIHSFYVPAFRIKQDVLPGRYTQTWFKPNRTGVYHLFCAEFCGTDHSGMLGRVVVVRPEDYAAWSRAQPQGDDLAREGEALFRSLGCTGCHSPGSRVRAPDLAGLYGRTVNLSDGRSVVADDAYIRDSILEPRRDVVAGFDPVMPSFAGQLDDAALLRLGAYIRSLTTGERP